jgi:hypothetical protein
MNSHRLVKLAGGAGLILCVAMLGGTPDTARPVHARDFNDKGEEELIRIGYQIAPVPLNLRGKNPDLVGLGSFLVNSIGDCNGCHTAGLPPNSVYTAGGNPYFQQKAVIDPAVYLSGGMDFGPVGTPTGPLMYSGPDIITRNLTPDKTGRAEGGRTLDLHTLRRQRRRTRACDGFAGLGKVQCRLRNP